MSHRDRDDSFHSLTQEKDGNEDYNAGDKGAYKSKPASALAASFADILHPCTADGGGSYEVHCSCGKTL
jgi:hypothetical protein